MRGFGDGMGTVTPTGFASPRLLAAGGSRTNASGPIRWLTLALSLVLLSIVVLPTAVDAVQSVGTHPAVFGASRPQRSGSLAHLGAVRARPTSRTSLRAVSGAIVLRTSRLCPPRVVELMAAVILALFAVERGRRRLPRRQLPVPLVAPRRGPPLAS